VAIGKLDDACAGDGNRWKWVDWLSGTGIKISSGSSEEAKASRASLRRFLAAVGLSRGIRDGLGDEMI
jgi:hypothetical protein